MYIYSTRRMEGLTEFDNEYSRTRKKKVKQTPEVQQYFGCTAAAAAVACIMVAYVVDRGVVYMVMEWWKENVTLEKKGKQETWRGSRLLPCSGPIRRPPRVNIPPCPPRAVRQQVLAVPFLQYMNIYFVLRSTYG